MPRKKPKRRRKPPRIQKQSAPGAVPGTIQAPKNAFQTSLRIIKFDSQRIVEQKIENVNQIRDFLNANSVTWVNVDGLGDPDTFHQLRDIFDLHKLALEDVVNVHQRSKVEAYHDHIFIVLRMVSLKKQLDNEQVSMFVGDNYVLTIQELDLLDTYRELCANLRDYHMSIVSNRMNEVMKVLTITGTIFIPLTFIAGIYGMNFNTELPGNMPELNLPYGYLYALLTMLATGLGLLTFVWRKGWLTSTKSINGQSQEENVNSSHDNMKV